MAIILEAAGYQDAAMQIVPIVFDSMLGFQVEPSQESYVSSSDSVTAAIFYGGSWTGATLLECSQSLAFAFTSRLMGVPAPLSIDDDVRDSMGELINMIGGNLKSVLPEGTALSLPSVIEGSYPVQEPDEGETLCFRGEFGAFSITLVRMPELISCARPAPDNLQYMFPGEPARARA